MCVPVRCPWAKRNYLLYSNRRRRQLSFSLNTITMYRSMLFIFIFLLTFVNVNSYGCSCSCCQGSGCSLIYLGTVSVITCASTTCSDACKATYTPCLSGSSSAVCGATNIFNLYTSLFLILFTFIFIRFNKF